MEEQKFGTKLNEDTRKKLIEAGRQDLVDTNDLLCSGYAGINKQGTIVDRRIDPTALPMPYNSMFPDTPPPKEVVTPNRKINQRYESTFKQSLP